MAHKSIRVEILGRPYPLRVREENEALTREIASYVNGKMEAFREHHSDQPPLTAAIITALALAEELYAAQRDKEQALNGVDETVQRLAEVLGEALQDDTPPPPSPIGDGAAPQTS